MTNLFRARGNIGIIIFFLGVVFACYSFSGVGQQAPAKLLDFSKIEAGMVGTGKTVVEGNKISTFDVKVEGKIDEAGTLNDFIIIRASGKAIQESGGIAQGMSGSPVYINGSLVGALSRSARWSRTPNHPIGLVTPIGTMLDLMSGGGVASTQLGSSEQSAVRTTLKNITNASTVRFADTASQASSILRKANNSVVVYPAMTPILVSGLSKHALNMLTGDATVSNKGLLLNPAKRVTSVDYEPNGISFLDRFDSSKFDIHQVSGQADGRGELMPLEPGAPFGASLTSGDIRIGALGTITYKDGGAVLGFGHRFLQLGSSSLILTRARIYDTVQSLKASFKMGSLAAPVGEVTQDRFQGVLGKVGAQPDLMSLEVNVSSKTTGGSGSFTMNLVNQQSLIGPLVYPLVGESIDRVLNRIGEGTVKVNYTISGNNMPQNLERTDMFFSTQDVSLLPSLQIGLIMDFLAYNPFQSPGFTKLTVDAQVTREINAGQIVAFATDRKTYQPGDPLAYQVKINHYRNGVTKRTGVFSLPKNLPAGEYVVAAYGGPRPADIAPPGKLKSFQDLLTYIEELKNYQHLSVAVLDPLQEQLVPLSSTGYRYQSIARTDEYYSNEVIYGRKAVAITVEKAKKGKDGSK